mmetsp:Transcript_10987/g.25082  ORF Transcript_10987/g.25082 Transcript_10987/m.25082 type:complete len:258 (-) Transcript_10987:72-845(-)
MKIAPPEDGGSTSNDCFPHLISVPRQGAIREVAKQEKVASNPQRPNVSLCIVPFIFEHLRRHVWWRSSSDTREYSLLWQNLRQPKITKLHLVRTLSHPQKIIRLYVMMYNHRLVAMANGPQHLLKELTHHHLAGLAFATQDGAVADIHHQEGYLAQENVVKVNNVLVPAHLLPRIDLSVDKNPSLQGLLAGRFFDVKHLNSNHISALLVHSPSHLTKTAASKHFTNCILSSKLLVGGLAVFLCVPGAGATHAVSTPA